jgi:hypothetical protein
MSNDQIRAVKAKQYATEYKDAAKEVMFNAVKLRDPQGNRPTFSAVN